MSSEAIQPGNPGKGGDDEEAITDQPGTVRSASKERSEDALVTPYTPEECRRLWMDLQRGTPTAHQLLLALVRIPGKGKHSPLERNLLESACTELRKKITVLVEREGCLGFILRVLSDPKSVFSRSAQKEPDALDEREMYYAAEKIARHGNSEDQQWAIEFLSTPRFVRDCGADIALRILQTISHKPGLRISSSVAREASDVVIQKGNDAEHCEFLQCHSPLLRSAQEAFARQLLSDGAETVSVEILCALIKEDLLAERAGDLLLSRKNLSQDILRNVHHTTKDTSIRAGAADLLLKDVQTSADVVRFILSTAHLDADICERAVRILLTLSPTLSELVSVGLSLRRTDPGYEDVAKAFLEMIENGETIGGYCDLESRHHTRAEREDRSLEYCIRLLATPFAARASRALSRAGPLNDDAQCLCARKFLEAGQTDDARKIVNVVFARALRFADDILLVECILLFPDLADDARLIRLPQEILSQVCGRLRRESTAEDAAAALEKVMHKNAEDLYRY